MKASVEKQSSSFSFIHKKTSLPRLLLVLFSFTIFYYCVRPKQWVEVYEDNVLVEKFQHMGDSVPEGVFESYMDDGKLFEQSNYMKGELHGEKRFYYANGKVQSLETMKNGMYHGAYMLFDSLGQVLQESFYENNITVGTLKNYYPNGQLKEEVNFENGEENGRFVEFYANGNSKAEGTYKDGDNEDGLLLLYDTSGVLIRKMNCEMAVCRTIWVDEKLKDE